MSLDSSGDGFLSDLDFEVDILEPFGPQGFVDSYSQAVRPGRVLDTRTFRGTINPLRNMLLVGPGGSNMQGVVEMTEGRLLVVASPDLKIARVLKIVDLPSKHGFGAAVMALFRREDVGMAFSGVAREEVSFRDGEVFTDTVDHRSLVKWVMCNFAGAPYPNLRVHLGQMSLEQKAEFTLIADVLKAMDSE
jgi:hypothetical protein